MYGSGNIEKMKILDKNETDLSATRATGTGSMHREDEQSYLSLTIQHSIEVDRIYAIIGRRDTRSPLYDKETLARLYKITEDRIPGKNFFPILLGITNAESSLGIAYA